MAEGGHDFRITPKGKEKGRNIQDVTSALAHTAVPIIGRHGLGPIAIAELVGTGAKKMEELVTAYLMKRKKLPNFDFTTDMTADFLSTCEAVHARLLHLNETYKIFDQHESQLLHETARQLREKQILISFVGHLNVGKSTLLNVLLGARILPIKMDAETTIMVHIHHDAESSCPTPIAASDLVHNGMSRVPMDNFNPIPSNKCPKLFLERKEHGTSEEAVGATKIYEKLEALNSGVRNNTEGHEGVCCTLKMNIPLLANTPYNWQVVLVDTPGTGEFNSRVAVAAEGALKSSSAYVFITSYSELESEQNAHFIQFLHDHDKGVFADRRLIIVVNQFDRTFETGGTNEKITAEKVREKVAQQVRKACSDVKISFDDVLTLSGLWAFQAQMLAMSQPDDEATYRKQRENVVRSLSYCQSLPCGQDESPSACLTKRKDDQLVQALLDASGLASLEARIHNVTTSCIKIWVSKMKGDYERYLKEAKGKLWMQIVSIYEQDINKKEKVRSRAHKYLRAIETQRRELEQAMESTSEIYGDLEQMYPRDLEDSKPVQCGKELLVMEMKNFEGKCVQKVKDEGVVFGPQELEQDLKEFLERMSTDLEDIFNSTCAFTGLQKVVIHHATKMGKDVEKMRRNARQLCATLNLSLGMETEAGKEEGSSTTPSLGFIKEKVNIPPVSLSKFAQIAQWISNFFDSIWNIFKSESKKKTTDHENPTAGSGDRDGNDADLTGATAKPSKSSSYRSWDKELESTMRVLEEHFQKECDNYFATIKQKILKYFHDQHCRQTRAELRAFDADFKTKIDDANKELRQLWTRINASTFTMNEQKQLHDHLLYLKAHLCAQADDYVKHYK